MVKKKPESGHYKRPYEIWSQPDNLLKIEAWARNGLTEEQIASNIGVGRSTLWQWKKKNEDVYNALRRGKEVVDIQVENALLKRALGYEVEEEKITQEVVDGVMRKKVEKTKKVVMPDVTAQIYWLKNRKPEDWRDRREVSITQSKEDAVKEIDDYFATMETDDAE